MPFFAYKQTTYLEQNPTKGWRGRFNGGQNPSLRETQRKGQVGRDIYIYTHTHIYRENRFGERKRHEEEEEEEFCGFCVV